MKWFLIGAGIAAAQTAYRAAVTSKNHPIEEYVMALVVGASIYGTALWVSFGAIEWIAAIFIQNL